MRNQGWMRIIRSVKQEFQKWSRIPVVQMMKAFSMLLQSTLIEGLHLEKRREELGYTVSFKQARKSAQGATTI